MNLSVFASCSLKIVVQSIQAKIAILLGLPVDPAVNHGYEPVPRGVATRTHHPALRHPGHRGQRQAQALARVPRLPGEYGDVLC